MDNFLWGPFSVDARQIESLGAQFGQFVNHLLASETAASKMDGAKLETTYRENVSDGGVDAEVRDSPGTCWLPAGESAWQFKSGNLDPSKCETELQGATWAHNILENGGSYRLVLGKSLNARLIDTRRKRLIKTATELGIAKAESKIDVIDAGALARWTEKFPSLALSRILGRPGGIGLSFDDWSQRAVNEQPSWVSSLKRDALLKQIQDSLAENVQTIRIEGVSGLGKTRLVFEALRDESYAPIVVYADASDFHSEWLEQLQREGRIAIVVIDGCDRITHKRYSVQLTNNSTVRLITIGEADAGSIDVQPLTLQPFEDLAMLKLLEEAPLQLPPELGWAVVRSAAGNVGYARNLGHMLINESPRTAQELISEHDIKAFVTHWLPDDQLFLPSCALSLFSRLGAEGQPAREISMIADGLDIPINDLRGAIAALRRHELISSHGRYLSVGPYPVAVYLAAKGWQEFGQRIGTDLIPALDEDLTERLFRRAAEIGESDAIATVITKALTGGGQLSSLESLAKVANSQLLVYFAILAPDIVANRLAELIKAASEEELLNARKIRRILVTTLQKIVWHPDTFEIAADALLRLALAENESYGNNAANTWIELFETLLPSTAARPETRMDYLQEKARSNDARVRLLVIRAGSKALEPYATSLSSGEMQGGVIVELRGVPATYGGLWDYRNLAIDVLAELADDKNENVAKEATQGLVKSLNGLLETPNNLDHLGNRIVHLSHQVIIRTRHEIESLRLVFRRINTQDERTKALEGFNALLPKETPTERLEVLANTHTWDRDIDDLSNELARVSRQVNVRDPERALVKLLADHPQLPAGYAIGRALQNIGLRYEKGVARLSPLAGTANGEALLGFLKALMEVGDANALDHYLDDTDLLPAVALRYSVCGPRTPAAAKRVDRLVQQMPIVETADIISVWMRSNAEPADAARYLRQWETRIATQADYNATIDFAHMQVFQTAGSLADLDSVISELVFQRRKYPDVGQKSDEWSELARRQLNDNALGIVALIADFLEDDAFTSVLGIEEIKLLQEAVRINSENTWTELMERIERGQWRLMSYTRDWLGGAASLNTVKKWVGNDIKRARLLAEVTKPDGITISPIVRYLLDNFGHDKKVSECLVNYFFYGSWSGNMSDNIAAQIAKVQNWIDEPGQSQAMKQWGRKLINDLKERQRNAFKEEAEIEFTNGL